MAQIWMDEENAGAHSKYKFYQCHQLKTNHGEFLARSAPPIRSEADGQHAAAAIGQEECAEQAGQCVASQHQQQQQ